MKMLGGGQSFAPDKCSAGWWAIVTQSTDRSPAQKSMSRWPFLKRMAT